MRQGRLQQSRSPQALASAIWDDVVERANRLLSGAWFGTAEQWAELASIEGRYTTGAERGDLDAVRQAAADYVSACERFQMIERAARWE